ncbi:dihydrodipicolinate synthase family protein [Glycomyces sp. L485]|uniref:dihydrodipicolinate synthase family protein n=1 Tax=Glycomyces sp. L485 TaxID=2909235 RepID=UPI001F4A2B2E|nr:dihydrodipicolinate synthase family protein [Glycomyces sp. L485]MCH7230579.1 dihydrodipicolinate synthase family protein [Glycomyces sp. L485]
MSEQAKSWHGIHVATALPFDDDLSVDYDGFGEHVRWLAENGMDGVTPNGSLGEYQTLTDEERARVVEVAVDAAPEGFGVMPGVAAYGSQETCRWIEQAAEAGARSVLLLPPNAYRADSEAVVEHYRAAARVGLPIVAYNNPYDTKVDLTPGLLAELYAEGLIVAVKEFTGDVRRAYEVAELAPGLDLLVGSDDVLLELGLAGAVGWIAGYPNALPVATKELYDLATSGRAEDIEKALPIYRDLHSLLRWDSKTEFVQAIKLSMDVAGRKGGACRPPRRPLPSEVAERVAVDTTAALAKGYK